MCRLCHPHGCVMGAGRGPPKKPPLLRKVEFSSRQSSKRPSEEVAPQGELEASASRAAVPKISRSWGSWGGQNHPYRIDHLEIDHFNTEASNQLWELIICATHSHLTRVGGKQFSYHQ